MLGLDKVLHFHELHFFLYVFVHIVVVLEYKVLLRILDNQLHVKAMKTICELWHVLVPFLPKCGPFYILIFIDPSRVIV